MWANEVTRNLNRSTWDVATTQPPPSFIDNLLRPIDSHVEWHLMSVARSAHAALECVNGSIADNVQLQQDWEAFGRRLQVQQERLETRKTVIEAFIRGVPPPLITAVTNLTLRLKNVDDVEHAE